jgi:hypothetical protein
MEERIEAMSAKILPFSGDLPRHIRAVSIVEDEVTAEKRLRLLIEAFGCERWVQVVGPFSQKTFLKAVKILGQGGTF